MAFQQQPQVRPRRACRDAAVCDAEFVTMSDLEFEVALNASPPAKRARAEPMYTEYRAVSLRLRGYSAPPPPPPPREEEENRYQHYDPDEWADPREESAVLALCSLIAMSKVPYVAMQDAL